MLNLSRGQVLKRKRDNREFIIEAIIDGATFMGEDGFSPHWYSDADIEQYFDLPKVRWVPVKGDKYWFVDGGILLSSISYWEDDSIDNVRLEAGNLFATKEAAEAAAEKIKKLLSEIHAS